MKIIPKTRHGHLIRSINVREHQKGATKKKGQTRENGNIMYRRRRKKTKKTTQYIPVPFFTINSVFTNLITRNL